MRQAPGTEWATKTRRTLVAITKDCSVRPLNATLQACKSKDGAKMVTAFASKSARCLRAVARVLTTAPKHVFLTSLSFELDHSASRFCESVHCVFQRLGCAASVCTRDALDRVAQ